MDKKDVIIEIRGGVGYLTKKTKGIEVKIIDHDNHNDESYGKQTEIDESKPKTITTDKFNKVLIELLKGETADSLLTISGIYEILSEHFNNEVIEIWENEQEK